MRGVFFFIFLGSFQIVQAEDGPAKSAIFFTPDLDKKIHYQMPEMARKILHKKDYRQQKSIAGSLLLGELKKGFSGFSDKARIQNQGAQNFFNELKRSYEALSPKGSLILHINNHGDNDVSYDDGFQLGYHTYNKENKRETVAVTDLLKKIKTWKRGEKKIKLIGTHCGGGGLHELSFSLPHVCSVAPVNHRHLYISQISQNGRPLNTPQPDAFSYGLYGELDRDIKLFDFDQDKKTSLFEGWIAGMKKYTEEFPGSDTPHNGYPSSFAWINRVLGADSDADTGTLQSPRTISALQKQFSDEMDRVQMNLGDLAEECANDSEDDALNYQVLKRFEQDFLPIFERINADHFLQAIQKLPKHQSQFLANFQSSHQKYVRSLLNQQREQVKKLTEEYNRLLKEQTFNHEIQKLDKAYAKEVEVWNSYVPLYNRLRKSQKKEDQKKFKLISLKMKTHRKKMNEIGVKKGMLVHRLQKQYDVFDKKAEKIYGQLEFALNISKMFDRLVLFMNTANQNQISKFSSLLKCEMESL